MKKKLTLCIFFVLFFYDKQRGANKNIPLKKIAAGVALGGCVVGGGVVLKNIIKKNNTKLNPEEKHLQLISSNQQVNLGNNNQGNKEQEANSEKNKYKEIFSLVKIVKYYYEFPNLTFNNHEDNNINFLIQDQSIKDSFTVAFCGKNKNIYIYEFKNTHGNAWKEIVSEVNNDINKKEQQDFIQEQEPQNQFFSQQQSQQQLQIQNQQQQISIKLLNNNNNNNNFYQQQQQQQITIQPLKNNNLIDEYIYEQRIIKTEKEDLLVYANGKLQEARIDITKKLKGLYDVTKCNQNVCLSDTFFTAGMLLERPVSEKEVDALVREFKKSYVFKINLSGIQIGPEVVMTEYNENEGFKKAGQDIFNTKIFGGAREDDSKYKKQIDIFHSMLKNKTGEGEVRIIFTVTTDINGKASGAGHYMVTGNKCHANTVSSENRQEKNMWDLEETIIKDRIQTDNSYSKISTALVNKNMVNYLLEYQPGVGDGEENSVREFAKDFKDFKDFKEPVLTKIITYNAKIMEIDQNGNVSCRKGYNLINPKEFLN
jgi:hypothetical protein